MISMFGPQHYSFQNGPILDSNPCPVSASLDQFKGWGFRSPPYSSSRLTILDPLTGPTQEVEMYTRNVSLKLKANPFSASEFADIFDREIIPLLRKQEGFHEEISFIAAERNEAVAISFWG
jgi:hypothetical protein